MDINFQKKNGEMISIGSGIAESGNGYIRFSDGTQICYGDISNAYDATHIPCPKPFSEKPRITCNYHNSMLITDRNSIYMFHVDGNYNSSKNEIILGIEYIRINTLLATADLGGHKHNIESSVSDFAKGTKSIQQPDLTLGGIYVSYIAIGRWK